MILPALFFYLFAGVCVASAVMVIVSRNPVHSVLYLILAFVNASGLFVLMGAEFLAMILVVVYVGAVAVLFLFVVMMLDVDFAELRAGFANYLFPGLILAIVLLAEMITALIARNAGGLALTAAPAPAANAPPNIVALGRVLYSDKYLLIFEAAGIVLLVAMIGAIVLTHRKRSDVRPQSIDRQVRRRPKDAVRNMQPGVGQGVEL